MNYCFVTNSKYKKISATSIGFRLVLFSLDFIGAVEYFELFSGKVNYTLVQLCLMILCSSKPYYLGFGVHRLLSHNILTGNNVEKTNGIIPL